MVSSPEARPAVEDRSWYIVSRWQEYEGEGRANLLRLAGIAGFYLVQLATYHGLNLGIIHFPQIRDRGFHQAVTAVAVAWTMMGLGILFCLRQQFFPTSLKYLSTTGDLILLTTLLMVANGPRSPVVVVYFLILALAAVRFSVPLVQFTSVGTMISYLALITYARWFATGRTIRVPPYQEVILLLALAMTGITLGQTVRRVRALANEYAERLEVERRKS